MILDLSVVCELQNFPFVCFFFRDVHKQTVIVRDESLQTILSGNKKGLYVYQSLNPPIVVVFMNMLKLYEICKA